MENSYEKLNQIDEIINIIAAVIALVDSDLNIIDSNDTFKDVLKEKKSINGVSTEETKQIIQDLVKSSPALLVRNPLEVNFSVDGKEVWVRGYFTRIQKDRYILCGQDITNSKIAENELKEKNEELENVKSAVLNLLEDMTHTQDSLKNANKELRQLDELKNEFISIASHELRTPMTSIKGYLSMILDGDAGEINEEVKSFLQEVYQSNERLVELVNDMLDVSRIEQKRMQFDIKKVKVLPVITESYERMKPMADEDSDELILETKIDKNLEMVVDFKRYQQVVQNLVENAVKFTEKGKVTIRAEVKGDFLETSIEDTGIGIPEDEQGRIFHKFYQVAHALSRPKGGSGLGLYISKNIVEGMGGKISVESKVGVGSTFSFTVPIAKKKRIEKSKD